MELRVLLFGPEAEAAGRREVVVRLDVPATCADVRRALERDVPALRTLLPAARFAVNAEFAHPDRPVAASDEVALIGLVSGG